MATKKLDNGKFNLNDRQKKFCEEYLEDLNATKAYQRAYECDYDTANRCGPRLLVNVGVKAYINHLIDSYTDNVDITVAEITNELKKIALDPTTRKSDRIKALELLGKYKRMFVDKAEIDVNNNVIEVSLED